MQADSLLQQRGEQRKDLTADPDVAVGALEAVNSWRLGICLISLCVLLGRAALIGVCEAEMSCWAEARLGQVCPGATPEASLPSLQIWAVFPWGCDSRLSLEPCILGQWGVGDWTVNSLEQALPRPG